MKELSCKLQIAQAFHSCSVHVALLHVDAIVDDHAYDSDHVYCMARAFVGARATTNADDHVFHHMNCLAAMSMVSAVLALLLPRTSPAAFATNSKLRGFHVHFDLVAASVAAMKLPLSLEGVRPAVHVEVRAIVTMAAGDGEHGSLEVPPPPQSLPS
jgi:hypothetical protein